MSSVQIGRATLAARSGAVIAERLADETVVLDPASDRYTRLNATGSFIWEAMGDGSVTVESLVSELAAAFGLSEVRALEDVVSFLGELRRRGLVTLEG